jgi:hypothetical protein
LKYAQRRTKEGGDERLVSESAGLAAQGYEDALRTEEAAGVAWRDPYVLKPCGIVWLSRRRWRVDARMETKRNTPSMQSLKRDLVSIFRPNPEIWWIPETLETASVSAKRLGIS